MYLFQVTKHFSRERKIHYAVEHPELPGLLKLVSKQSSLITPSSRRKANRHKSPKGDFWWACGLCFFERRKKSTIKAHLIQRVCQKTIDNKKQVEKLQVYNCNATPRENNCLSVWKSSLSLTNLSPDFRYFCGPIHSWPTSVFRECLITMTKFVWKDFTHLTSRFISSLGISFKAVCKFWK